MQSGTGAFRRKGGHNANMLDKAGKHAFSFAGGQCWGNLGLEIIKIKASSTAMDAYGPAKSPRGASSNGYAALTMVQ